MYFKFENVYIHLIYLYTFWINKYYHYEGCNYKKNLKHFINSSGFDNYILPLLIYMCRQIIQILEVNWHSQF